MKIKFLRTIIDKWMRQQAKLI